MDSYNVGLFGGSFDPIHYGHLSTAKMACDYLQLSQLYFIPARVPPHKKHSITASAHQRHTMLKKAIHEFPKARILTDELDREGPSYTIDTLYRFRNRHPHAKIHYIIGSDNLREIPTWHRFRDIITMVSLCVTKRPGYGMTPPAAIADVPITALPSPQWALSSSLLRKYFSSGIPCTYLLPEGVIEYIVDNNVY